MSMTLAARNGVFYLGIVLTVGMLSLFGLIGYSVISGSSSDTVLNLSAEQSWLGVSRQIPDIGVVYSLAGAGILGLIGVISLISATRVFRRVNSAEVYFFTVFLIALSPELLRIGQIYVTTQNLPPLYGSLLTRGILLGRIFGALSLFTAGLYAAGMKYPRIGTLTLLLVGGAFFVVYLIPVDTEVLDATLLHRTGGEASRQAVMIFLAVGTIANYFIAWLTGRLDRGVLIVGAVMAMVVGTELLFHVPAMISVITGLVLVGAGSLVYIIASRAHYLWY